MRSRGPWIVFHVLYKLAKGPRVLNWKGKEGSILALYRPGQEQILNCCQTLILGVRVILGYEIGENRGNGGKGGGGKGKYHILQHGPLVPLLLGCCNQLLLLLLLLLDK